MLHAEWYEWLWTGMGLVWLVMTAWGSVTAWRDYRYVCRHPARGLRVQAQLLDVARGYLRYEASSLVGGLLVTAIGGRALLLPSNPASPDGWAAAVGLAFVGYALLKTTISVQNRLARRHFDHTLERTSRRGR